MKSLIAALFSVVIAVPLSAGWSPLWSTYSVEVPAGQTATISVRAYWTGLVDYGDGPPWTFKSDPDYIASASVVVRDSNAYDGVITAHNPGTATIHQIYSNGASGMVPWVTIHVTCGDEPIPVAIDPIRHVMTGEIMTLAITTPAAYRTNVLWFLGEAGDTSQPIQASGPEIAYIPRTNGRHDIWASAVTACSTTLLQFRIESVSPKHRAAGR